MDASNILQRVFGYSEFRGNQAEIIEHASGRDALVLMPTGGGKSFCYQIPALAREGVGIIVSPLIALMQDQVDALLQLGVKAAFLNSSLDAKNAAEGGACVKEGKLDLLYVAPERLLTPRFIELLQKQKLPYLPLMKRIASRNGDMIFVRSMCSFPFCMNISLMCRALH